MSALKFGVYPIQDGRFEASYINPVTNKRHRHKFSKRKDAQSFKENIERQLSAKNYGYFVDTHLGKLIDQHLKDYPNSRLCERQNVFKSFYGEFSQLKMSDVTHKTLITWFDRIKAENNYSDRTLNSIKSQINSFFRSLIDDGLLEESPLSKIKFKRVVAPKRPRIVLSIGEVNQMLENSKTFSPNGLYPYLATVAHTGARKTEVLNLKREDIDFGTGLVHIKRSKNGRERFIRMSRPLEAILRKHLDQHSSDSLFANEHGNRLGSRKEFERVIAKFKAFFPTDKNWGCHSLRHSFANNFLQKGGEMYQLQAILGHRSIDVTIDLYGQLAAQHVSCPTIYGEDK